MNRFIAAVLLGTVLYLLTLASVKLWDIVQGAIITIALLIVFRRFLYQAGGRPAHVPKLLERFVAFWPFVGHVLVDIVHGTVFVIRIVLRRRPLQCPGIVTIPIAERSANGVAVSALASTLSPGSFLVDVDEERGVMLMHVIDASDPDGVRADHQELYVDRQRHVFP